MIVLAIDPGTTQSAYVMLDTVSGKVGGRGILPNEVILAGLRDGPWILPTDAVVIEQVASYGMPVGAEVFATVRWSGRFEEAAHPIPVHQLTRLSVKSHLCHSARANDATIRQALLDRWGGPDSIRKGGPLHGVVRDVWSALALACVFADRQKAAA